MRRHCVTPLIVVFAFSLLPLQSACQSAYFMMLNEPKKKIAAEFDKLGGKPVAIVVWADQATLDEDYAARYRTADAVRYHLSQQLKDAKLIDIREITRFQESSGNDWEGMTNAELGKEFKADFVLRVDLLEYTVRAREAREVRKGRIRATVSVYDVTKPGSDRPVYGAEIAASYPQDAKTDVINASDSSILNGALAIFGEKVAQKFVEHEESY